MAQITEVPPPGTRKSVTRELIETVVLALVVAFVIRTVLVEPYWVKGSSMADTLHDRDRVLVNKLTYRFVAPQRGDVIVFQYPRNPADDFIKRVVGVAGDTVELRGGKVYVNGQLFREAPQVLPSADDFPATTVPADSVWVLGDNRTNSEDSRIFGEVPLGNIRGTAIVRIWPLTQVCRLMNPEKQAANGSRGVLTCP
ncbi:MAG: signal peptidase I [Mycobacterium leprae]